MPRFLNSHDMSRYCNELMEILWDDNEYKKIFMDSERIIRLVSDGNLHRDNIRTEPFTEKVIERIKIEQSN